MFKPLLLCLFSLMASPALAQSQSDVLDGALMPGWRMDNGHHMAALHLTLAPHWKTYWRAPGEAGIPPQFDWSASQNVQSVALHWPSPEVILLNGMQSIGYLDELVLPLGVVARDPSKPVDLRLTMQLGICKDICMPATLTLAAPLTGTGDKDRRIEAALALGPITSNEAGLVSIGCDVTVIDDGLRLAARIGIPRQGDPETVVFEAADASVWVAGASSSRDGHILNAATDLVPQTAAPFVLDRSGVTITVIGQGHSVEIRGCPAP